jgi:hypothetical protein
MGNLVSILFKCGPDFLEELRLQYLPDGSRVASNIYRYTHWHDRQSFPGLALFQDC